MTSVIDLASVVVVLLAIVAAGATFLSTHHRDAALPVLLDLLLAAGLLHLAAGPSYSRAATAAVVLAIRRLVSWGLSPKGKGGMPTQAPMSMDNGGAGKPEPSSPASGKREPASGLSRAAAWVRHRLDLRGPE